jgi:hypothetical protein
VAPVVLVTGCCDELSGFWSQSILSPNLIDEFNNLKIPYSDRSDQLNMGRLAGSIKYGALQLGLQIPASAGEFGANRVHLVAHSKGGLNVRWLLDTSVLQNANVGVLSLTTLDTPHQGSLGSDLLNAYAEGDLLKISGTTELLTNHFWLEQVIKLQIAVDFGLDTVQDLTQQSLQAFNAKHRSPPQTSTVGSTVKTIKYWALSSDANLDGSVSSLFAEDVLNAQGGTVEFATRTITPALPDETIPFEGLSPHILAPALQAMYNLMGDATSLTYQTDSSTGVTKVTPFTITSVFNFNDFVVTIESQSYQYNASAFVPLTQAANKDSHNAVPSARIADLIINNIKSTEASQ